MIILAFLIGTFATIIGALPPGASNLAVIKTTLNESTQESLKVTFGAGIGEMLLAFIAFSSGMVVKDFFNMNLWVQYLVAGVLALVGFYFIIHKKQNKQTAQSKRSKYLLGFTLGVINPPVLIYWILVFSLLGNFIGSSFQDSTAWLLVFLAGVFLGKVGTLYGYSKLGLHVQKKKKPNRDNLDKYIGITLILLAIIQLTKLTFL